jgi:hypothetical protein
VPSDVSLGIGPVLLSSTFVLQVVFPGDLAEHLRGLALTSSTIPSTPCSAPRFKAPAPEAEQPAEPSFERVTLLGTRWISLHALVLLLLRCSAEREAGPETELLEHVP